MIRFAKSAIIAASSFGDAKDKADEHALRHAHRVAEGVAKLPDAVEEDMVVAMLHDVIEDTPARLTKSPGDGGRAIYWLIDAHGQPLIIPEVIHQALDAITRRDDETYREYIFRVDANPIARRVKLVDIEDNLTRTPIPDPKVDRGVAERHVRARAYLTRKTGGQEVY